MTKQCTKCKIHKSIDEFSWKNKSLNKKHSSCKECHREVRNLYYKNNSSIEYSRVRNRKRNLARWFKDLKKTMSCKCGESHPATLQFHHLNPDEKDFAVSVGISRGFSKAKILAEIEKCEVVCANCHAKIHYEDDADIV